MEKKKITVFGSFVVDLTSWADHLPVAGETAKGNKFLMGPGGKGSNQAVAAKRADGDVTLITKVGNDVFGSVALDFYKNEQISTDHVFIDQEIETGSALIMVDRTSGQNQILVVSGACDNITADDIEKVRHIITGTDILLLQLEINMDALERVVDIAHAAGKTIVLNTAPAHILSDEMLKKIDIITPNEIEAGVLSGVPINDPQDAQKVAGILLDRGVKNVVITLGKYGVLVKTPEKQAFLPALKVEVLDTTGAGDAFNGGFVAALAENMDIFEAARFGNAVAALSVTKLGTAPAMPYRNEIDALLNG